MPSPLKRPSLVRLLSSLRPPPSRPGSPSSFPVQTGFPTSLADIVVRNHGRLRKPRKQRRPGTLASPPSPCSVANVEELPLTPPPPPQPLSPGAVAAPQPPEGAAFFRLRQPHALAVGGAVALSLLAVWSEGVVAVLTVAAVSLLWIESASRRRQRRRPAEAEALPDSCVSPIREAEASPRRSSCSDSDKRTEPPSPRMAEGRELVAGGDEPTTPKRKGSKRSLRKLISKKLQKKLSSKYSSCPVEGEAEHPDPDAAGGDADQVVKTESLVAASESRIERSSSSESVAVAVVGQRGSKRSLRKLISKELQKKLSSKDSSCPIEGEAEHPEGVGGDADPVLNTEPLLVTASESSIERSSSLSSESVAVAVVDRRGLGGVKFPLSAFVPVILAGLAAGKLPATALAVLCVAFSCTVQRLH